jgi:hypothetical protein
MTPGKQQCVSEYVCKAATMGTSNCGDAQGFGSHCM